MKVKFINKAEIIKELELAGWTASVSYDSKTEPMKIAKHCLSAGHGTPFRASRFVFEISEVSRAFSHEFVRHEIGVTKVQRSQRYVNEDGFRFVTPDSLEGKAVKVHIPNTGVPFQHLTFVELQSIIEQFYNGAIEQGIKPEDARYALSNATYTKLHVSFNWEALQQFCFRRCCTRAQWEIREVANEIRKQVLEAMPFDVSEYLGAPCKVLGYCPEANGCGIAPSKKILMEYARAGKSYIIKEYGEELK